MLLQIEDAEGAPHLIYETSLFFSAVNANKTQILRIVG